MRARGRWALIVALLATLLAGCALPFLPPPDDKAPPERQTLHMLVDTNGGGHLDPTSASSSTDTMLAQLIFPPLVTVDARMRPIPWAANRWDISPDGLIATFHLQPGMQWSDGTPLESGDFAYAINRGATDCELPGLTPFQWIDNWPLAGSLDLWNQKCARGLPYGEGTLIGQSVLTPDAQTLVLKLARPSAQLLAMLTTPAGYAVPRHLIARWGNLWTQHLGAPEGTALGGNLFTVTEQRVSPVTGLEAVTLERNERFWGRKPTLRRIEITAYRADLALGAFREGKADAFAPIPWMSALPQVWPDALASTAGRRDTPYLGMTHLWLNWKLAPFDDLRVRQAFALAVDRRALYQDISYANSPTIHMVPDGLPAYNAGLRDALGRTGDAALIPDLDSARRLAKSYTDEKCHGDFAQCPPVRIVVGDYGEMYSAFYGKFVAMWQAAFPGWRMEFVDPCHGACIKTSPSGRQMQPFSWYMDYPDPQDFLTLFGRTGADLNFGSVSIPEADALLDQAELTPSGAARDRLFQQAEQLYITQVAWIPLSQLVYTYFVHSNVANLTYQANAQVPLPTWQRVYLRRSAS